MGWAVASSQEAKAGPRAEQPTASTLGCQWPGRRNTRRCPPNRRCSGGGHRLDVQRGGERGSPSMAARHPPEQGFAISAVKGVPAGSAGSTAAPLERASLACSEFPQPTSAGGSETELCHWPEKAELLG